MGHEELLALGTGAFARPCSLSGSPQWGLFWLTSSFKGRVSSGLPGAWQGTWAEPHEGHHVSQDTARDASHGMGAEALCAVAGLTACQV